MNKIKVNIPETDKIQYQIGDIFRHKTNNDLVILAKVDNHTHKLISLENGNYYYPYACFISDLNLSEFTFLGRDLTITISSN